MATYLPAIERPKSLVMKIAYFFTRRVFGKVITPLKVHSARLPAAFGLFYKKIPSLDRKLTLPDDLVLLIRQRVARLNACHFCMDSNRWYALRKAAHNKPRFDALEQYSTSTLFSEAERAALDYATKLTKDKQVNQETFDRLSRHYSEREICEVVWLVASEHLYNLTNIGLNVGSDGLCNL